MSEPQGKVFLVDDDAFSLFAMMGILRAGGYTVETFEYPEALLTRLTASDRGCVVLDLQMPGLNGLELQSALVERRVAMPLLFVSGRADVPAVVSAMKQGAVDFLCKPVAPDTLLAVVERMLHKDAIGAAERSTRERTQALWAQLSQREQNICRLAAKGLLNKQIAAAVGVAESTVQAQRARLLKKLGMDSIVDLVRLVANASDEG